MKKFVAAIMVALLVSLSGVAIVNAAQPNVTPISATVIVTDVDLASVSGGGFSKNTCTALKLVMVVGAICPGGTGCAVAAGVMEAIWC
jgi:hypothetical protein